MRGTIIRGALLLAAWAALTTGGAWAQYVGRLEADVPAPVPPLAFTARAQNAGGPGAVNYAPADPQLPLPIGSTRPEDGGLYPWVQATFFRFSNPLKNQQVAQRGFLVVDNSIADTPANTFIGTRAKAFDVQQVSGPNEYQLGFELGLGYKFSNDSALSVSYLFFSENNPRAVVTQAPKGLNVGPDFAESFLFSPVYNFPNQYAGPPNRINQGSPFALFGIWDGAAIMTEDFIQRFQQYDITYRQKIYDTECYRLSGLVGPRFVWIWERYRWRTTAQDLNGDTPNGALDTAVYTNIVSNRMWGVHAGTSQEWYLGHGFACMLNLEAGLFIDAVKEQAKYALFDKFTPPQNKRALREWRLSPELQGQLGVMWYPTEFIQIQLGYDVMTFFNTISSPRPIDFNYSALKPAYDSTFRIFDGFRFGVSFLF
jgi:hypothetical protein